MIEKVEDTYCEAFDGYFCRLIITAKNEKYLRKAVIGATALPSSVFGKSEAGIEKFLKEDETPDGRVGAIIQIWVAYKRNCWKLLQEELGWRIRQGVLVVPTTRVFNAMDSGDLIDTWIKIGRCGDGYEFEEYRFGRKMINIPIMFGEFLIERYIYARQGIMGGNLWFMCKDEDSALKVSEKALEAIKDMEGIITPFDICSAGSKPETKYPDIGPTTNHYYCPTLRNRIPDSKVPENVGSIPEIVINGISLEHVKKAMRRAIISVKDEDGLIKISAGNYGGKLGKYKIFLRELI